MLTKFLFRNIDSLDGIFMKMLLTLDSNKKQIFSAKNGTDFLGIFKYINILKDLVAIYFSIASYHFQIFCHKNQLFHFQSSSHHRVWTLSNGCMWT